MQKDPFSACVSPGDEMRAAPAGVIRVWDAPTRLFHWTLVVLIGLLWWSGEAVVPTVHKTAGLTLAGLLVFRIYWGFFGSTLSRFTAFITGPRTVTAYARTVFKASSSGHVGHNPLGGWSVLVMLALLAIEVGLGLFAVDVNGLMSGPLSHFVTFRDGRSVARLHSTVFNLLMIAIVLHVAAVLFYLFFKKENLLNPMVTGRKHASWSGAKPLSFFGLQRAMIGIMLAALVVWALSSGLRF